MHGLVNRSLQCFVTDTYGHPVWLTVCAAAGTAQSDYEAMLDYDDGETAALLRAAARHLGKAPDLLLEDLGHYLVTHLARDAFRRLLRFGGADFADFLHSLTDLRDRARLVLPEIDLPRIDVTETATGEFRLALQRGARAMGPLALGVLRAMADDYGTLALFHRQPPARAGAPEIITVQLLSAHHSEGRSFALGRRVGA